MSQSDNEPSSTSRGLAVRDGFHLPPEVKAYLAHTSIDALAGQGPAYRTACRSLSELTRIVGEVLRRARARARLVPHPAPQIQPRRRT